MSISSDLKKDLPCSLCVYLSVSVSMYMEKEGEEGGKETVFLFQVRCLPLSA